MVSWYYQKICAFHAEFKSLSSHPFAVVVTAAIDTENLIEMFVIWFNKGSDCLWNFTKKNPARNGSSLDDVKAIFAQCHYDCAIAHEYLLTNLGVNIRTVG